MRKFVRLIFSSWVCRHFIDIPPRRLFLATVVVVVHVALLVSWPSVGSTLAERSPSASCTEDEMVQQFDAHDAGGLGHPADEVPVLGTGRWITAGVSVEERHAACASQQALLQGLAGLDPGVMQGAAVDFLLSDQAVADVEEESAELRSCTGVTLARISMAIVEATGNQWTSGVLSAKSATILSTWALKSCSQVAGASAGR
jgi:hypothetical protein